MSTPTTAAAPGMTVRDTPLEQVTMGMAKEEILLNLFRRFQGTRPDLEERLQTAYKSKYGRAMRVGGSRDVRAIYLEGEPGHGKTTTHREACKEFASLMGMKFMNDPSLAQMKRGIIDDNTFVFSTITIAGATSKHEVGGLMAKMKIGNEEFMGHLPDWKMAATMMGGFGYILFDDFVTSSHQVQNACLDLLLGGSAGDFQFNTKEMAASKVEVKDGQVVFNYDQEKANAMEKLSPDESSRGASPVHIGLAGNRGSRDGNKTFPMGTATITRLQRMDVFDTVEDFVKRAQARFTDDIGDAHYGVFIKTHPELFSAIAKPMNGIMPSMPCPRTHDALLDAIGVMVHNAGGFTKLSSDAELQADFLENVKRLAGTHIGREIEINNKLTGKPEILHPSSAVSGFYSEMLLGALPKAEEIIKRGIVDTAFIEERYGAGVAGSCQNFGYQFASALASLAAADVSDKFREAGTGKKSLEQLSNRESELSLSVRETMRNMSYGLTFLQKQLVSFSIDKFLTRLSTNCPELFDGAGAFRVPVPGILPTLIFGLVKDNKRFDTTELRTTFADSLSQATNGYLEGQDATIEAGTKMRKEFLSNALKVTAP